MADWGRDYQTQTRRTEFPRDTLSLGTTLSGSRAYRPWEDRSEHAYYEERFAQGYPSSQEHSPRAHTATYDITPTSANDYEVTRVAPYRSQSVTSYEYARPKYEQDDYDTSSVRARLVRIESSLAEHSSRDYGRDRYASNPWTPGYSFGRTRGQSVPGAAVEQREWPMAQSFAETGGERDSHRVKTEHIDYSSLYSSSNPFLLPASHVPQRQASEETAVASLKDKGDEGGDLQCKQHCADQLGRHVHTFQAFENMGGSTMQSAQNEFLLKVLFSEDDSEMLYHTKCVLRLFNITKGRLLKLQKMKFRALEKSDAKTHGLCGRRSNNSKKPETLTEFLAFVKQHRVVDHYGPENAPVYRLDASMRRIQGDNVDSLRTQFNLNQQRLSTLEHPRETISSGTAQAWFKRYFQDTLKPCVSLGLQNTARNTGVVRRRADDDTSLPPGKRRASGTSNTSNQSRNSGRAEPECGHQSDGSHEAMSTTTHSEASSFRSSPRNFYQAPRHDSGPTCIVVESGRAVAPSLQARGQERYREHMKVDYDIKSPGLD
eukprot:comp21430_c1_seq1/m.29541 comp21430_c1_seq1/g.29541  ORF comp21430_c1_seq1/g.29541 comp21430_c1_seq1/m.29541 type:complete len:545 (-) comp21430_c1_seq1:587-2221(-)